MLAAIGLTVFECPAVFLPSLAVSPVAVPPVWMLTVAALSAKLGLSTLSPVIIILRDDFPAMAGSVRLVYSFIAVVFIFLVWHLQRACYRECDDLQHARRWTK